MAVCRDFLDARPCEVYVEEEEEDGKAQDSTGKVGGGRDEVVEEVAVDLGVVD